MANPSLNLTFYDAIQFDWDKLQDIPSDCYLVPLSLQGISVLYSSLRFAENRYNWRESETALWGDVEPFINQLKGSLLMGCNLNDLVTQLTRIADSLESVNAQTTGSYTSNDVLDQIASGSGVSVPWATIKAGLIVLFPDAAIPIGVGLSVIEFLVNNSNSNEAETFEIAKMLGSTSGSLPD